MTSDIAHEGIRKILNLLEEDELKQLASTSTQNRINTETLKTKEEAIDIIIKYSADYSVILNRKCVKRDILFQYLHNNKIFATPPITKLLLIQKILDYWSSTSALIEESKTNSEEIQTITSDDINMMANKFSEWFYNMLNSEECVGEEHFWQDCNLQINLVSASSQIENSAHDRSEVVNMLNETKRTHDLFFNPNLTSEGIYGKMDAHGLVLIFVCGTLHTKDNCVGIFEQIFSLARDPFCENNWKIKNTRLNLRSKEVIETPKLCDSEISDDVLLSLTNS